MKTPPATVEYAVRLNGPNSADEAFSLAFADFLGVYRGPIRLVGIKVQESMDLTSDAGGPLYQVELEYRVGPGGESTMKTATDGCQECIDHAYHAKRAAETKWPDQAYHRDRANGVSKKEALKRHKRRQGGQR